MKECPYCYSKMSHTYISGIHCFQCKICHFWRYESRDPLNEKTIETIRMFAGKNVESLQSRFPILYSKWIEKYKRGKEYV